ncbi:MAG: DEAD/DEAH box helicase [Opitutales bacterium]
MIRSIAQYFAGVGRAMQVRAGRGGVHADAGLASEQLKRLTQVLPKARAEIIAATEAVIQEAARTEMAATPIADLKDYGASVGPLQSAGFRMVADLSGHSIRSLLNYRGIGDVTASAAIEAFEKFQSAARANVRLLPDPDNRRPSDGRLLVALAKYETLVREVSTRTEEAQARFVDSGERLQDLRAKTRLRDQLLSLTAQEGLARSTSQLAAEFRWVNAEARNLSDYAERLTPDFNEVWKRYAGNSAPFIALLESVLPAKVVAKGALAGPDMRGGLPAEIADAVEATKVDLRLLTANLRRYQQFGVQYVVCQKRVLLGDDMGLGKTIQVLAAMCHLAAQGKRHFFVVAPNSVLINWEREVKKHTKLNPIVVHGFDRDDELEQWHREGGVAITTYTTLGRLVDQIKSADLLAVDEAHAVKNPDAQRTQSVVRLCGLTEHVVFMSGTALENRLSELQFLVKTVQPKVDAEVAALLQQVRPAPAEVRTKLAPVYLRRTQADVLTELPDLTETDELIPLEPEDVAAYRASPDNLMHKRLAATIGAGGRQSAKFDRLRELLEGYEEDGRKVAVFSFFRQVLDDVSATVGGCPQIHGSISAEERQLVLDRFAAKEGFGVIALQIEAGGVGINLQCAQVVILMEPQFKPSTERQAIARVRRMGQTRKVNAHRLIAKGTVDEALVLLIEQKKQVFEDYAQHSSVKDASGMAIDAGSAAMEELRGLIAKA